MQTLLDTDGLPTFEELMGLATAAEAATPPSNDDDLALPSFEELGRLLHQNPFAFPAPAPAKRAGNAVFLRTGTQVFCLVLTFFLGLCLLSGTALFFGATHPAQPVLGLHCVPVNNDALLPAAKQGDLLLVRPLPPEQIAPGDLAAFWRDEASAAVVVRRVAATLEEEGGLAFSTQNSLGKTEVAAARLLLGKSLLRLPKAGVLATARRSVIVAYFGLCAALMLLCLLLASKAYKRPANARDTFS
ncbi:MAG: hypothetical protein LBB50_06485 [Oscillospiraceae bacterium]|jgi:hypothetical protein|nr:hypothetical protein [Oscillospiraceae bacterium]